MQFNSVDECCWRPKISEQGLSLLIIMLWEERPVLHIYRFEHKYVRKTPQRISTRLSLRIDLLNHQFVQLRVELESVHAWFVCWFNFRLLSAC